MAFGEGQLISPLEHVLAESAALICLSQKAIVECHFFPTFEHMSRPKYQKIRNIFFVRHLKLMQLSVKALTS